MKIQSTVVRKPFQHFCINSQSRDIFLQYFFHSRDQMAETHPKSYFLAERQASLPKNSNLISIVNRFYITTLKYKHAGYNAYNGIDISTGKWVTVYLRAKNTRSPYSVHLKEETRNALAPRVLWEGTLPLNENTYHAEVHEKTGPSLKMMRERLGQTITARQLLHLLLELIKLAQKLANNRLVNGQLSPDCLYLDANPNKNDLYLLNCFGLRRRNQTRKPYNSRYCSRGSHLARNAHPKDDLESLLYILLDLYQPSSFLFDTANCDYLERKTSLRLEDLPRKVPEPFLEFYCEVNSLNFEDEFNFFHWKNYLARILTPSITSQPYNWLVCKPEEVPIVQQPERMVSRRERREVRNSLIDLDLNSFDCSELEEYPECQDIGEQRSEEMASRHIHKKLVPR